MLTTCRRPSTRKSTSLQVLGLQNTRLPRVQNQSVSVIYAILVSIKQTMKSVIQIAVGTSIPVLATESTVEKTKRIVMSCVNNVDRDRP